MSTTIHEELRGNLERVRSLLETITVRGLRACGTDELAQLQSFAEDLERSGAAHVAGHLHELRDAAESGERAGARALLVAQTSVRLLERVLTLRVVGSAYETALALKDAGDGATEEVEGDEEEDEA